MDEQERRKQLKDFLRARREALRPETVGLEAGPRRRTPGLRREEVAAVARVGVTWYTWLEQGREIRPSREALHRIAGALRLSTADEAYFLSLCGEEPFSHPGVGGSASGPVAPATLGLLDALATVPALIWGSYLEVLAHNKLADAVYAFDATNGPFAGNHGWRLFMDPARRALYGASWDAIAEHAAGEFRVSLAAGIGGERLGAIVDDLVKRSLEFRRLWRRHQTHAFGTLSVALQHPRMGALKVEVVRFRLVSSVDQTMSALMPRDARTARVFSREAKRIARARRSR